MAGGQILAFPIDIDRRPYNTLALPCECVICMKHMYIKYKTHNTVYTQHNQLHKNTLQYGSSTSGARDSLNLLSGVKSMLLGSEFNFCLY